MIDGNQLREEFGRYLAEHKATRWGMDAALMHVCKIAYDAGKADGPGAALHSREYEIEVPAGLDPLHLSRILHELAAAASLCWEPRPTGVFDSQLAIQFVEQALAEIRSRMTPAPAEVQMPQGYAERPTDYTGQIWIESQMRIYGVACRAAGEAAGYVRAANWLRTSAEKHAGENGYHEHDTGAFVFASREAEEWNNSVLELADEMEAALRGEVKP